MTIIAYTDATLLTGDAVVENHALLVQSGMVVDIVGMRHIPAEARRVACGGLILAPGLIDLQVNGGGNVQFNTTPTAESCLAIAAAHRRFGTTRLLPTCMSDSPTVTQNAMAAMREARAKDTGILGIHLEGPHLAPAARGIHDETALRPLQPSDVTAYKPKENEVVLVTLAPENALPEAIATLKAQGNIISIGHTKSLPDNLRAALKAGATGFTHLYNGMGGLSAREPGVSGTALTTDDAWCGLIADGDHVAPEMIRLAARAKPRGKLFLVSDAMAPAASTTPHDFQLYGTTYRSEGTRCLTAAGKLAGSGVTLLQSVQHCVRVVGLELDETLRMASTYPAAFIGHGHEIGKLLPGYAADIIALTPDLDLKQVF